MKALEFKSKISNNRIHIPKKIQAELRSIREKNVRVMIFLDDPDVSVDTEGLNLISMDNSNLLTSGEQDSINNGLKDLEEGRIYSHETARKLYEKYYRINRQNPQQLENQLS